VVFFNYTTMQMTAKIVYYGPGLCGKTTNLQWIHHKTAPKSRGEMVSLETETDRTLFFDLLPIDVGVIGGMKVRLQLYTVPGQVFYNATRKLVLKGVDGVVFVADSQVAALEANVEAFANLKENLAELSLTTDTIPLVMQYNKRDIRNIVPVEKLNEALNPAGKPYFEAAALHGIGVFETLKEISRLAITAVRRKVEAEDPRRKPQAKKPPVAVPVAEPEAAAPAPPVEPAPAAVVEAAAVPPPNGQPAAEVKVEFAEADAGPAVRPVSTKANRDIHDELAKLRKATTGKAPVAVATVAAPPRPAVKAGSLDQRLQDILGSPRKPEAGARKKTTVEIPARLLKDAASVRVQLTFEGPGLDTAPAETVTISLTKGRPDVFDLVLELKPK
jgi:signal recognition particle receptor subunit beta